MEFSKFMPLSRANFYNISLVPIGVNTYLYFFSFFSAMKLLKTRPAAEITSPAAGPLFLPVPRYSVVVRMVSFVLSVWLTFIRFTSSGSTFPRSFSRLGVR